MKRRHLIPLALVLLILVPRKLYGEGNLEEFLAPSLAPILVWILRTSAIQVHAQRRQRKLIGVGVPSAGLTIFSFIVVLLTPFSISPISSVKWTVFFLVFTLFIVRIGISSQEFSSIRKTWLLLALLTATYAVLENFMGANVLYDAIYSAIDSPPVQNWSVYRSHASFGHPLYAALFLSMSFGMILGQAIDAEKRGRHLIGMLVIAAGVFVTGSRSGVAALMVTAVSILMISIFMSTRLKLAGKLGTALVVTLAGAVLVQLPAFQDRLGSVEAQVSSGARDSIIAGSIETAAESSFLGSGPGTADLAFDQFVSGLILENGYLQLLISTGALGTLAFCVVLFGGALWAIRTKRIGLFGALIAYAIMLGAFNALESNPSWLLALGIILASIMSPRISANSHVPPDLTRSLPSSR